MTSPAVGSESYDVAQVGEVEQNTSPFQELGVTGLKRSAGYIDEEFLTQLKGRRGVNVYREMSDNDPIVGAMVFAVTQLVRNSIWNAIPAGKGKESADAARLIETCKDDMSSSWDDMISEAMSCIIYGWSWHEIVYKRRMGPWQKDGSQRSKHSDGMVGWRKMPIRAQDTLQRWAFDETGGIQAMVQIAAPDYSQRIVPMSRSLLFRYGQHRGSPEGRSMLRNAYRPWFYKKRLEEFESIGVERDLAGLPMVKVPSAWLKALPGSPQHKQVESFKKMVRGIRRNEQEGLIFPTEFDADTKQPMFDFSLVGSGGQRQFQTDPLIKRYEERILMTCLADFIMVGHSRVGTYNLHVDKTGIFRTALNALLKSLADVINRHAIPRLFLANGWKPAELPRFEVEDVDAPDISQLAGFLSSTAQLGFTWGPDAEMETYLRKAAGLPAKSQEDTKRLRTLARREESTRFAESQTRYLATRSELAAQMAAQAQQAAGEAPPEQAQAMAQQEAEGQQQVQAQEQQEKDNVRSDAAQADQLANSAVSRLQQLKPDPKTAAKPAPKEKP